MKLMKHCAVLFAALPMTAACFASSAFGQDSGAYGAIGGATYDFENYGVDAKLGYEFNKYYSFEVEGILGLTTDDQVLLSLDSEKKVDYSLGAFGVARLPLSERVEIFVRAGVHETKYRLEAPNIQNSELSGSNTGVAAGTGFKFDISDSGALRADYTYRSQHDDRLYRTLFDKKIETVSVGYVRKF